MNIIPIVLMDGTYINASTSKYDEAIAKGFTVGVENTILTNDQVNIYPNPAEDMTSVQINLTKNSDVVVSLRTISGQIIVTRTYENLSGENLLSMPLQLLNSGMYLLDIKTNQGSRTEKIVIK
ncbi:MAG: T9SS type A sorting domain-containing protein [Saprospiraceae bacterium]|nr:T9SS type A sorting domain-containing protein [Saprospiraceae bacterium]